MPPRNPKGRTHRKPPCWALVALLASAAAFASAAHGAQPRQSPPGARVAIIIDDLGYRRSTGERAIALPGPVTLSILPESTHARPLAEAAIASGKELMLHIPMEPHNQVPWERGLSGDLLPAERTRILSSMVAALPGALGINNHMGSKFTEEQESMDWLMGELKQRQLYFVDSFTSAASRGWQTALSRGVPSVRRDIFLDNVASTAAIERQLLKLFSLARERGQAVAIGHPYPATLDVLELYLPQLSDLGVELVPISQLFEPPATSVERVTALKSDPGVKADETPQNRGRP